MNNAEPMDTSMNLKEKAALTTLGLNTLLTVLKFILYGMSGSLAVLAEAWHSFPDIATSITVYIAVRRSDKARTEPGEGEEETKPRWRLPEGLTLEHVVSAGIGLLLCVVAFFLFRKFFFSTPQIVRNPLVVGLIFLGLSLGSHFVYRFESAVGRREQSIGLLADSMHARTDMVASLLAGFSLILYSLGLDVDKWVAGLIALIVFSFALETIVNVTISVVRREKRAIFRYRSYELLARALAPRNLSTAASLLDSRLRLGLLRRPWAHKLPARALACAQLGLLLWWLSSCLFTVQRSEQAIVERFGRPTPPGSIISPGLHLKAPWPVDRVVREETQTIRRMEIGNTPDRSRIEALLWTRRHGADSPFLSGENDFFYPYLVLHYRIKNLYDYLYVHEDPEALLEASSLQIACRLFATKSFYEIALDYRERLVIDMVTELQETLDRLDSGLLIVNIGVSDIHPPITIADAYEEVIAARQEKERMINEALAYRNQNLPEARGKAMRLRTEAEAYVTEQPLRARGDASMFLSQVPGSPEVKSVTMRRLYLTAMLETLRESSLIVIDPMAGRPDLWLGGSPPADTPANLFGKLEATEYR